MQEDLKQTFENLLQQELVLMGKFIEHLNLARNTVDNDQVRVFLDHLLEEEEEHKQQVAAMLQNITRITPHSPAQVAISQTEPLPSPTFNDVTDEQRRTGHHQRRDQNVLTVGSLYGQPQ